MGEKLKYEHLSLKLEGYIICMRIINITPIIKKLKNRGVEQENVCVPKILNMGYARIRDRSARSICGAKS
jgi:hypothetical protein